MLSTTLHSIRSYSFATTDAGVYAVVDGDIHREFLVKGTIISRRPSLTKIDIEGTTFTATSNSRLRAGDVVLCTLSLKSLDNGSPVLTVLDVRPES